MFVCLVFALATGATHTHGMPSVDSAAPAASSAGDARAPDCWSCRLGHAKVAPYAPCADRTPPPADALLLVDDEQNVVHAVCFDVWSRGPPQTS